MARPRKHPPEKEAEFADQIEKMAAISCTWEEIATILSEPPDYLRKRFSLNFVKGREHGKMTLRRKMFEMATKKDNVTMMIWLSKQWLGYTDKQEIKETSIQKIETKVDLTKLSDAELADLYKKRLG